MLIPKQIHIAWKSKDILQSKSIFVENCIRKLVALAPDWNVTINDDDDIDEYLKNTLDALDYDLLKDKHIVEKSDVWRLIKLYNEGGLYVDIDRLCNVSLNDIIPAHIKMVIPTSADFDFSHDFMCSAPSNPIFLETLKLNLERRFKGSTSIYFLGPQTYFHGVTKSLTGKIIDVNPGKEEFNSLRELIDRSGFMMTYKETSVYDTILYRREGEQINFDHEIEKRRFYAEQGLKHWTQEW